MSDAQSLRDQLKVNPHDFHLMAVYADCLDEADPVYVKCRRCNGDGEELWTCKVCGNSPNDDGVVTHGRGCYVVSPDGGGDEVVDDGDYAECLDCGGSGELTDDTSARLAEGYRAMALVRPVYDAEQQCWWGWQSHLPRDWYANLSTLGKASESGVRFDGTLVALDCAALAWSSLPPDVKERIRTTGPWAPRAEGVQ